MPRRSERQPTPIGRFLVARRLSAHNFPKHSLQPHVREALRRFGGPRITQDVVATIGNECMDKESHPRFPKVPKGLSRNDVIAAEHATVDVPENKLYWILRGLLMSRDEAEELLGDKAFIRGTESVEPGNPHLLGDIRLKYALGDYGPHFKGTLHVDGAATTWVPLIRSHSADGFDPKRINLRLDRTKRYFLDRDEEKEFEGLSRLADQRTRVWKERREKGHEAPSDNDTIALVSVSEAPDNDENESLILNGRFIMSRYAFNKVVKDKEAADHRWQEIQSIEDLRKPTPVLTSGIGIAINVICDGGAKIVTGIRSASETFRKHERDVAVVEGIRPTANVDSAGRIDLFGVLSRALDEELGLAHSDQELGIPTTDCITKSCIFEFGVDLEYYQYNFLSYVITPLSFEQINLLWKKAKDRGENKWLEFIPSDKSSAIDFVKSNRVWGSGVACMISTYDFLSMR